jgi:hypothetical protein
MPKQLLPSLAKRYGPHLDSKADNCEDVLDPDAELVGGLLPVGEMRVDGTLLHRLDRVHRRRCRLDIGVAGARAAAGRPIAAAGAARDPRLLLPAGIVFLQASLVRQALPCPRARSRESLAAPRGTRL